MNILQNEGVYIYNIFCWIFKYVIHLNTAQPQMTAKDSADEVLGVITAAGATAA